MIFRRALNQFTKGYYSEINSKLTSVFWCYLKQYSVRNISGHVNNLIANHTSVDVSVVLRSKWFENDIEKHISNAQGRSNCIQIWSQFCRVCSLPALTKTFDVAFQRQHQFWHSKPDAIRSHHLSLLSFKFNSSNTSRKIVHFNHCT